MTEEQFSKYLVEIQGFTNDQAAGYIKQVGLEPGIKAMEEQHQLENAVTPEAPEKTMSGSVGAGIAGVADSLTFGNLEKVLPKEALQKLADLKNQYPVESGIGNTAGSIATMMLPSGAISKIPQVAKLIGNSGKLKALTNILGGAATGAAYGFAQNPKVNENELSARVGQMALPAALGGALGLVPGMLEKGGEAYYKSAFKKLDAEAKVFNAENTEAISSGAMEPRKLPSDIMFKKGYTGSAPDILGKIKSDLNKEAYPVLQNTREELSKLHEYPTNEMKNQVLGTFDDPTKRTAIAPAIEASKKYTENVFDNYMPSGWFKKLRDYSKANKGYQTEKSIFEAAGGSGEQLPLMGNNIPIRAGDRVKNVELIGQPASIATSEPLEHWTQQGLMSLQTPKIPENFNVPSGDPLLPLAQNMKMGARTAWMQHGPRYQAEILGLQNTPRSYTQIKVPTQVQEPGQASFSFEPQAPGVPVKAMSVPDFNRNMTDIGKSAADAFESKSPGETGTAIKEQLAKLYKVMSGAEEKAVQEKLGMDTFTKFKKAKEEVSQMYNIFPDLKSQAEREVSKTKITPMEGMFMMNPKTAPYAIGKEAVESLQNPYLATNIGKFMNKVSKSKLAPTNLTPSLLNTIRNNKPNAINIEDYPGGN